MALKRLLREAQAVTRPGALPEGITISPAQDDPFKWDCTITGPPGTPYEGAVFPVQLVFPPDYPFKPPKVSVHARIYSPHVVISSGSSGLCKCSQRYGERWSPAVTIPVLLSDVRDEFSRQYWTYPVLDPDTAGEPDRATLRLWGLSRCVNNPAVMEEFKSHREVFEAKARYFASFYVPSSVQWHHRAPWVTAVVRSCSLTVLPPPPAECHGASTAAHTDACVAPTGASSQLSEDVAALLRDHRIRRAHGRVASSVIVGMVAPFLPGAACDSTISCDNASCIVAMFRNQHE